MIRKIRSDTEFNVIQNWLKGMKNDENSLDCGISTGAVSNIVNGWLDSLDVYDRQVVVEFIVQARKEKIKVKECAVGFRNYNMLKHLGISGDDENFVFFVKELYELSRRSDIPPNFMHDCILEMINISKEIKPSQIKDYLKTKKVEIQILQNQLEQKKEEVRKIEQAKLVAEKNFASMKNKIDITLAELDWYINIKNDLEKEGLPVDNTSYLARTIKTLKKYSNKEIFKILQKINNEENLDREIESKKHIGHVLSIDTQILNDLDRKLSYEVSSKTALLKSIDELERLGFGIQNLRKIRERLNRISSENQMDPREIEKRFFEFLSEFDEYITLENEKAKNVYLISEIGREISKERAILTSQGSVGIMLKNLMNKGYNENHIIRACKLIDTIEKFDFIVNNWINLLTSMGQIKPKPMTTENKEFKIIPSVCTNQNFW